MLVDLIFTCSASKNILATLKLPGSYTEQASSAISYLSHCAEKFVGGFKRKTLKEFFSSPAAQQPS